jgi:mRNA-degrading endonuclease RelE of RelBE toxin-antitoxin system
LNLYRIDLGFTDFVAEYKTLLKKFPTFKNDLKQTLEDLEKDPKLGDQMPRVGNNTFKVRLGLKGQFGKRSGFRLIYHVDESRHVVTLLALYFKPDTPNLPDHEVAERFGKLMKIILQPSSEQNPTL